MGAAVTLYDFDGNLIDLNHPLSVTMGLDVDTPLPVSLISNGDEVKVDSITNALSIVEYEHHEIHSGSYYRSGYQKDVSNGGTAVMAFTTSDSTKWIHFRPAVDGATEHRVQLFENPTSITSGSTLIPRNANRNSTNESTVTVVTDPTYDLTGAIPLGNVVVGLGKSTGGNSSSAFEWVLKQNTIYLMIVTNLTVSSNQINIRCQWYEHTNI